MPPKTETLPVVLEQGNCRTLGIDALRIMYPEEDDERGLAIAKSVCSNCVCVDPCRDYAVKHREQGVWGETSEKDRRTIIHKIRKNRNHRNDNA